MKQAVLVFAIALVITLAIGPAVINYLRKMKFGQKILEIGPKWHMNKQNIPTMGGFMFIIGIAAAVIIGNIVMGEISVSSLAVLGLAVAYGVVGLVDDYNHMANCWRQAMHTIEQHLSGCMALVREHPETEPHLCKIAAIIAYDEIMA